MEVRISGTTGMLERILLNDCTDILARHAAAHSSATTDTRSVRVTSDDINSMNSASSTAGTETTGIAGVQLLDTPATTAASTSGSAVDSSIISIDSSDSIGSNVSVGAGGTIVDKPPAQTVHAALSPGYNPSRVQLHRAATDNDTFGGYHAAWSACGLDKDLHYVKNRMNVSTAGSGNPDNSANNDASISEREYVLSESDTRTTHVFPFISVTRTRGLVQGSKVWQYDHASNDTTEKIEESRYNQQSAANIDYVKSEKNGASANQIGAACVRAEGVNIKWKMRPLKAHVSRSRLRIMHHIQKFFEDTVAQQALVCV